MAPNNPLHLNLTELKKKLETLPATQLHKLDSILGDIANESRDAYEEILDGLPKRIKTLNKSETEIVLNDLLSLQKQVIPLRDVICEMNNDYDSHYMDRAKDILGTIEEEIPSLIDKLKKKK